MRKIILQDRRRISPFNEPARDLRVLNKPLWLHQRDLLVKYCTNEFTVVSFEDIPPYDGELLIYRANIYFNELLIQTFIEQARRLNAPCRIAFRLDDPTITQHILHLQDDIKRKGDYYWGDMWYYPYWPAEIEPAPLVIDSEPLELGLYNVPRYMVDSGDFVYQVPLRAFLPICSWVHILLANTLCGPYSEARRALKEQYRWRFRLRIALHVIWERKHYMQTRALVKIGKRCEIDPTAVIVGPTTIGNNVTIGPGAVIAQSLIGDNVNIMQGCQIFVSVVSDGCWLPMRAALFATTMMENSTVAQNSCLQGCVIGRNSFIGANTCFTDLNLLGHPIRTMNRGRLQEVGLPIVGGAVGHDCRLGSGLVIYPARTIESGTILVYRDGHTTIERNVSRRETPELWEKGVAHTNPNYRGDWDAWED
ncbi:MAG: multidrug transporter [Chloroflexi bacterium]|nr:multidrug transporter [Chloroflexota bacterium]MBU1746847.1 multidrug transporter [Chloroflexota bacterium]MBU1878768.1 multidrug transporter [Chloroflexota bacterium]